MSATKAAEPLISARVTVELIDSAGQCPRCLGRRRYAVRAGTVLVGYLISDHPWHQDIPDDPEQHPSEPHYEVEWSVQDAERRLLDMEVTSFFHVGAALRALAAAEAA